MNIVGNNNISITSLEVSRLHNAFRDIEKRVTGNTSPEMHLIRVILRSFDNAFYKTKYTYPLSGPLDPMYFSRLEFEDHFKTYFSLYFPPETTAGMTTIPVSPSYLDDYLNAFFSDRRAQIIEDLEYISDIYNLDYMLIEKVFLGEYAWNKK